MFTVLWVVYRASLREWTLRRQSSKFGGIMIPWVPRWTAAMERTLDNTLAANKRPKGSILHW